MPDIAFTPVTDYAALGARWRALEARAAGSFFQGWTWTGCLVEERFPDPVLLEARHAGETIGLALFNRRRGRLGGSVLHLGESGDPLRDSIYIEHNGPLIARGFEWILPQMLDAARRGPARRLMLSGVGRAVAEAVPARVRRRHSAPYVDLAALRGSGTAYLDSLSRNARQQLRRAVRAYEARGCLLLTRAEAAAEAEDRLAALAALHARRWPGGGAFTPAFARFHQALLARGLERGEIDLLRLAAGDAPVGYLYNFRYRGRVSAYQGGFDYAGAGPQGRPGLVCHLLAIEQAAAAGLDAYDFLAGDARYKTSLARDAAPLYWLELRRGFWRGAGRRGRAAG